MATGDAGGGLPAASDTRGGETGEARMGRRARAIEEKGGIQVGGHRDAATGPVEKEWL